jgi:hypothetical protein
MMLQSPVAGVEESGFEPGVAANVRNALEGVAWARDDGGR